MNFFKVIRTILHSLNIFSIDEQVHINLGNVNYDGRS